MNIQTRKLEFIQAFLKLQSEELVSVLENILKSETKDNLKPMSIDELSKRIDCSEKNFETENYKSHEEVFAKYN